MESYPGTNSMKNILSVFALILAALGGYFALQSANTYIRYMGFRDCAQVGTYEVTVPDENARVTYPLQDVYDQCLRDKGLSKAEQK